MDGRFSCDQDALCPICHELSSTGQPCSERCREQFESDLDSMYLAELDARENAEHRMSPEVQL